MRTYHNYYRPSPQPALRRSKFGEATYFAIGFFSMIALGLLVLFSSNLYAKNPSQRSSAKSLAKIYSAAEVLANVRSQGDFTATGEDDIDWESFIESNK